MEIPIYQILSKIVPFFEMVSDALISQLLYVKRVFLKIRTHYFFHIISVLEFQVGKTHKTFNRTLTPIIFSYEFYQFRYFTLQIFSCLVPYHCISIQIQEEFLPFSLRDTCFTNQSQKQQSSTEVLSLFFMNVYIKFLLSRWILLIYVICDTFQ